MDKNIPCFDSYIKNYIDIYTKECLETLGYKIEDIKHIKYITTSRPGSGFKLIYYNADIQIFYDIPHKFFKIYIKNSSLNQLRLLF